uniref:Uncharacterized protein n=1 Tax=Arundo donax TaxID=35708 RepID=A0A0A9D8U6_ARUDO
MVFMLMTQFGLLLVLSINFSIVGNRSTSLQIQGCTIQMAVLCIYQLSRYLMVVSRCYSNFCSQTLQA